MLISKQIDESTEYYLPANDEIKTTQTEIDYIKEMKLKTFDQFKQKAFKVWTLTMINNEENWSHNVCSCPDFFKKFMCKHIVGFTIQMKYCKPPLAAKDVPIGEKRKRGRPKKATKALLRD